MVINGDSGCFLLDFHLLYYCWTRAAPARLGGMPRHVQVDGCWARVVGISEGDFKDYFNIF